MNANAFSTPEPNSEPAHSPEQSVGESLSSSDDHPGEANSPATGLAQEVESLRQEAQRLKREIASLQSTYSRLQRQVEDSQGAIAQLVQEGLKDLEQRRQALQISVEQLERRQERIKAEMRSSFAGASQDLAIRVQGFKDYLVGSLQDLATAAEQLMLVPQEAEQPRRRASQPPTGKPQPQAEAAPKPQFAQQGYQEEAKQIRYLLDQYRMSPDYYGPPWQLRRTFEPIHADRVANWFFNQGGRGAVRTMGSRLQNILVVSAAISILRRMYGDRVRVLVLADSPERLGEWRRGLQDCLGISRADFGANQGVVLFESPEPLAQRADRLVKQDQLPLIVMDEAEDDRVSMSLLQFPLWLAIAADPNRPLML
jgi:gas vesicle protein